ncbi:hypothetical protein AB0I81_63580 [Nonomuraea sp. NPDC050404]|uniref:AbiJ-related protein n=1 Tax=Nonomuraea sp. NPDC050404 TaxID=3155783 RepID=UPI0033E8213E
MLAPVPPAEHNPQPQISAITRRDIFDQLRSTREPWHGRLDEITFLEGLYNLDTLPSDDSRYTSARGDIAQHRINNLDWDDDWIFEDPRLQLLHGPDEVLFAFLARLVHPEVQPDTDRATRTVDALNRLLAPDGWALRAREFLSGRPIYRPARTERIAGPVIPLPLLDEDASKLDLVLGQVHYLLDEEGHSLARDLLREATLTLRRDGGFYHPTPGDNWRSNTYEAVLIIGPTLAAEFTPAVLDPIWEHLRGVLRQLGREDVMSLVVEEARPQLPPVSQDWRQLAATPAPSNQARRERKAGEGYPTMDELVFGSRAELVVYQVLTEIQRDSQPKQSIAILPLPSAKLRDTSVRSPDFVVIGNGRAVVIEVDGPHHYGVTRKADDEDRDRHWMRCGTSTIRIAHQHTEDPVTLKERLREDLQRTLLPPR